MKNPLVAYALARIGVFAVSLTALLLLGFNGFYATCIATAVAFAFSLVFLRKQRETAASDLYSKVKRDAEQGIRDKDTEAEDGNL
jgi:hypothetical protein